MSEVFEQLRRWRFAIVFYVLLVGGLPSGAQTLRQVTNTLTSVPGPPALDDAGSAIWTGTSTDQFGVNPTRGFQVVRFDPATGTGTTVLSRPGGISPLVSVSDDGQWVAFPSYADLAGQNHDQSIELFVMRSDGTQIKQLTNDAAVNAGSVSSVMIAGGGTKVFFVADTNPTGGNAAGIAQIFSVNRDGSALTQLTHFTSGSVGSLTVSDDATKVAFLSNGNPTGGNADLGQEVFAMNGDGTSLRQLTAQTGYNCSAPVLAGGGSRIAFQTDGDLLGNNTAHQTEIFLVDFAGTNLKKLTTTSSWIGVTAMSMLPSITDDGVWIYYCSTQSSLFVNLDGNIEVFKIKNDGTGQKLLTNSTALSIGSLYPVVSGNNTRVAFYTLGSFTGGTNPDASPELCSTDLNGSGTRQLTVTSLAFNQEPALTPDAQQVAYVYNDRVMGNAQLWRIKADGSGNAAVITLSSGQAHEPSIAADATTVVFYSDTNATGLNADTSTEVFRINLDGTGLTQLTNGASGTSSQSAVISATGGVVVFDSNANLTGGNADGSREIFRVNADGTGLLQLTSAPAGVASQRPRIDDTGTWVVFESTANLDGSNTDAGWEVYRVRTDGTALAHVTADAALSSRAPDIAGAGDRIAYSSAADPLGTNPEHNAEIFVIEPDAATSRQLTTTASGSSSGPRLSHNGAWVWFSSDAPIAEALPGNPSDMYRVPATGGAVQRIGGPRLGASVGIGPISLGSAAAFALDASGERAVLALSGNPAGGNADMMSELYFIDRTAVPRINVGKATPTLVTWDVESGPLRYDVIRGDCANLAPGGAGTVTLGVTACLENDSPDATIAGFEDAFAPAAGHALFYAYRGSEGLNLGPGSYGTSSAGGERLPSTGDCAP